jgi:hypothetical protein
MGDEITSDPSKLQEEGKLSVVGEKTHPACNRNLTDWRSATRLL